MWYDISIKKRRTFTMRKRMYKICALLLAGILGAAAFTGCSPKASQENTDSETAKIMELTSTEEASVSTETEHDFSDTSSVSLGEFTAQDIEGETYTAEMFQDYDLTMVNVFTTWCSPCINEIPELQKLKDEMADEGINVIGVVLDASDGSGNIDEETVEKARLLAEKTGVSYTFLLPDDTNLNGRLDDIYSVPETFFVDKDGNIVGETYVGSRSLEDWRAVVEEELSNLKGMEE